MDSQTDFAESLIARGDETVCRRYFWIRNAIRQQAEKIIEEPYFSDGPPIITVRINHQDVSMSYWDYCEMRLRFPNA